MAGADLTRKVVRDTIKSLLIGNTDALANVFTSRVNKSYREELPGIFIYTPSDTPIISRKMEQDFPRTLMVIVEILVDEKVEGDIIEDIADKIAGQVEDILLPNVYLQDPPPQDFPSAVTPGPAIVNYIQITDTSLAKVDDIKEDVYGISLQFTTEYYYCKSTNLAYPKDLERFGHDYETEDKTAKNLTEIPPP